MREKQKKSLTYRDTGVDTLREEEGLRELLGWVRKTLELRSDTVRLDIGYFANVIDIGYKKGIVVSTDGVGTKILVAQMMDKYDTIGIDCVAMNVNDVLCLGAEPVAMLNYLALEKPEPYLLGEIGKGLYEGARIARVTIPGGETAQIGEMIRGKRQGRAFDLVGMCIGLVSLDRVIDGSGVKEGDVVVGIRSSGIHSNGLSLARRVFFDKMGFSPDKYLSDLGTTVGDELLKPTRIYVPEVMDAIASGIKVKSLIHITGDGLLNLSRVRAEVGFVIGHLPEPQPVFHLIRDMGGVGEEEMYRVFNMGIGFCIVVLPDEVDRMMGILNEHGVESYKIGYATCDPEKRVIVTQKGLVGKGRFFSKG